MTESSSPLPKKYRIVSNRYAKRRDSRHAWFYVRIGLIAAVIGVTAIAVAWAVLKIPSR
jgi:hypothetical protein